MTLLLAARSLAQEVALPALPAESVVVDEESGIQQITITSPAAAMFDRGKAHFEKKQYGQAIREFIEMVKRYPKDRRREHALYYMAESYRLAGEQGDAVRAFIYLTKQYPNSLLVPVSYLRIGDAYYQAGQYENAIPYLANAAQAKEVSIAFPSRYLLAACQLNGKNAKQRASAIQTLREIADKQGQPDKWEPYRVAARQALAVRYESDGKSEEAVRYWKMLARTSPSKDTQALAAARAGWNTFRIGKGPEAEQLFQQALKLKPSGDSARIANTGLLKLYYQSEKHAELLKLIQRAGDQFLKDSEAEVLFAQGNAQFRTGDYAGSVRTFTQYETQYPQSEVTPVAAYLRLIATAQIEPGQLEQATGHFLKSYSDTQYGHKVRLMRARELQKARRFPEALELWRGLASVAGTSAAGGANAGGDKDIPRDEVLFEKARAEYELKQWTPAAESYTQFAQTFSKDERALGSLVRAAVAFEQAQKKAEARQAWQRVLKVAPGGSIERQTALERMGSLALEAEDNQQMASSFTALLKEYPKSEIRNFAAYWLGSYAFDEAAYSRAEDYLILSRRGDEGKRWEIPASERLALLGWLEKDREKTQRYATEFEQAVAGQSAEQGRTLPVGLYFWLGQAHQKAGRFQLAADSYGKVLRHPENAEFKQAAAWERAECQRLAGDFAGAAVSYERYREWYPELADSNQVLFALAKAQRGATSYPDAEKTIEQLLRQNPEGDANAQARLILGDIYFDQGKFEEAASTFGVLAVAFDDPKITPRAIARTAESFDKQGKTAEAAEWRAKLVKRYPDYIK